MTTFAQIAKPRGNPEPAFECCPSMHTIWGPPTINYDWMRYSSVCISCGFTGHVVESTARPGSSAYEEWVGLLGGLGL